MLFARLLAVAMTWSATHTVLFGLTFGAGVAVGYFLK